ncbi:MAG TPA: endolytic transglycosylase MltG [Solirubrobacterales bacterium]|jgi:cell division protein YceG involved in septum cleavage|nr:endolytic transglycosylase MltG [Solirubrobacterales bacterium]
MSDDLFAATDDPVAAERERRRLEREERRRKREAKNPSKEETVAAAPPGPPPSPPTPPPPPAPRPGKATKPRPVHSWRRRLGVGLALGAVFLGIAAIAVLAYRHFHRSAPPPVVVRTVTLTIPEGYTRSQTAEIAKSEGLRGGYEKASVHSKYLNPAKYGGKDAKDLEGFLFPDTFELVKHARAADLVQLQLEDFKRRIAGVSMSYARSKNLTVYDVVTIASMIEHEAGLDSQRRLVAAVIYNRLHDGMPLGIDATTRFATGNYTRPLTESELAVESPYNTRTHAGLPPGPIDSPGLASIEAAAHPAKADYLYYVAEPGACNKLAFSSTEAEFNADVERYDSAREAAGGNSPDSCGE